MNENNSILEFIRRRFSKDCNWLDGNCYFFALILSSVFKGKIYYDPIDGHFVFLADQDGCFYDWSGKLEYSTDRISKFYDWINHKQVDSANFERIMRDCIN